MWVIIIDIEDVAKSFMSSFLEDKIESSKVKKPFLNNNSIFLDDIVNNLKLFLRRNEGDGRNFRNSLRSALKYSSKKGYVLSAPEIIFLKTFTSYDVFWKNFFTAFSEEVVWKDNGTFYEEGTPIVVVTHGTGLFLNKKFSNHESEDFTYNGFLKYSEEDFYSLLKGEVDGEKIPLYSIDVFKKGILYLPREYGVVLPLEIAVNSPMSFYDKTVFVKDPLIIARAGNPFYLDLLYDKAIKFAKEVKNNHGYEDLDLTFPIGLPLTIDKENAVFTTGTIVGDNNLNAQYAAFVKNDENEEKEY